MPNNDTEDTTHERRGVAPMPQSDEKTSQGRTTSTLQRPAQTALLEVVGLKTQFFLDEGLVRAVDGVDLAIDHGKTVCVVGESGCGKSITARSILGLVDPPGRVVAGNVWWNPQAAEAPAQATNSVRSDGDRAGAALGGGTVDAGLVRLDGAEDLRLPAERRRKSAERRANARVDPDDDGRLDLAALDPHGERLRQIRGAQISMIFQEPMASLSPMYTVGAQLTEVIRLHTAMSKQEAYEHALSLLRRVGIPRADQRMHAYSFQLSGGMCQRVMIAIALACSPRLLIADEPTTALDVTTQARIIDLLVELQSDTGMAMMFITHDLGVVAEIADEVLVMYLGTVAERGSVDDIFHDPKHPYTKALLRSIPKMGMGTRQRLPSIEGSVPHPLRRPPGCPFHPRCDYAIPGLCDTADPPNTAIGDRRRVRCVLHDPKMMADHQKRSSADPGQPATPSKINEQPGQGCPSSDREEP